MHAHTRQWKQLTSLKQVLKLTWLKSCRLDLSRVKSEVAHCISLAFCLFRFQCSLSDYPGSEMFSRSVHCLLFTVRAVATDCIFSHGFFFFVSTITRELLHTAWWNFARACTLTTARNPENFKVIGQRSRSQDRIFGFFSIARYDNKVGYMITHEPLHSAWWYIAWTCTLTTPRTLLNFKVISQRSRSFFSLVDQSLPNCFRRTCKKS